MQIFFKKREREREREREQKRMNVLLGVIN